VRVLAAQAPGRIVNTIYDQALEPVGLRASQLALMWAIVAMEPVDMTTLGATIHTDQTHAVANRADAQAPAARQREARRGSPSELLALSAAGKARFAAAMPYWENAQREAGRIMPLDVVDALGKQSPPRGRAGGLRTACAPRSRSMRSRPGFRGDWGSPPANVRGGPAPSSRYRAAQRAPPDSVERPRAG
jgi:hypothetical protein